MEIAELIFYFSVSARSSAALEIAGMYRSFTLLCQLNLSVRETDPRPLEPRSAPTFCGAGKGEGCEKSPKQSMAIEVHITGPRYMCAPWRTRAGPTARARVHGARTRARGVRTGCGKRLACVTRCVLALLPEVLHS